MSHSCRIVHRSLRPSTSRLTWCWAMPFAVLLAACGSDDPVTPPGAGTLQLSTATSGVEPDPDGYTIMVDGTPHGTIGPTERVTVTDVEPGEHTIELAQIQFNC